MQAKIGDTVRFLNSVGGGRIVRIQGQIAYVDEDGFETPVLLRECVVVASGDSFYDKKIPEAITRATTPPSQQQAAPSAPVSHADTAVQPTQTPLPPVAETQEGEKLNIVLGFEPADIKRLSDTSFDAYLVNDSNYTLLMTIATRSNDSEQWTLRYSGSIDAQMQEFVFELTTAQLPEVDSIAVQIVPYKPGRDYTLKTPVNYERRFDATRLARLHCFDSNPYFDTKVVAVDIVTDDTVHSREPQIDARQLEQQLAAKKQADRRAPRPATKRKPEADKKSPLEIDLHASELLDTTAGLSKSDILNYQIDTFRKVMDENLRNIGRTIIFIHGKGEGVLRQALIKELTHRYKGHDVSDASFREYGFGATKVVIKNVK